ncbi:MAG: radical SAM protein [Clostridia bacterium]|nr:radical SAM protein [Clostridia bacterium]
MAVNPDSFICDLCPRRCHALRTPEGGEGYCKMPSVIYAARAALHYYEEPVISGDPDQREEREAQGLPHGSGTVFFSGCSLNCVFCQNYSISHMRKGAAITPERLAEIFCELQDQGANNINLVNPTHYVHGIREALRIYRSRPDHLPVVYNTSGYDRVETLRSLEGLIDIYLPDMKYVSSQLAQRYSDAGDYFEVAVAAIAEMYRQVGKPRFNQSEIMTSGVIVRHLVLPHDRGDTLDVIDYIASTYGDNVVLSIMSQYTPLGRAAEFPEINRPISTFEYLKVARYLEEHGTDMMYYQERSSVGTEFVPEFDLTGIVG